MRLLPCICFHHATLPRLSGKMLAERKKKLRLPQDPNNKNWTDGKPETTKY